MYEGCLIVNCDGSMNGVYSVCEGPWEGHVKGSRASETLRLIRAICGYGTIM